METTLPALRANAAVLQSHAGNAKLMAVVKANAYGHGVAGVVRALVGDVDFFGVANVTEARDVALHAQGAPVMILGTALAEERAVIVAEGFVPVVSSAAEAAAFAEYGRVKLHLAVDTGMGRMGVWQADALAELRAMLALPDVEVAGFCSHLPVADADDDFTRAQLAHFGALANEARAIAGHPLLVHVENSAGVIGFPGDAADMVRAGLALYGVAPRADFQPRLRPALTWKSRVILVRDFSPGRSVSYGRAFVTSTPTRIATIAVGYADGYPRQLSDNGAEVLIAGRRCAVLGRVTMDQIMADVTGIDAREGDEVVLLGRQGDAEVPATELAEMAGTIAWDIFTGIGARVVRTFVE